MYLYACMPVRGAFSTVSAQVHRGTVHRGALDQQRAVAAAHPFDIFGMVSRLQQPSMPRSRCQSVNQYLDKEFLWHARLVGVSACPRISLSQICQFSERPSLLAAITPYR